MLVSASSIEQRPWRDRIAPGATAWRKSRGVEMHYGRQLRGVARHVGQLIRAYPDVDPQTTPQVEALLVDYSRLLTPWAKANAELLWRKLNIEDFRVWKKHSNTMSRELMKEVYTAPTGQAYLDFMKSQVDLITSIPRKAAQRVHQLVLEGMEDATRGAEIQEEILRTTNVTESRATLIARTEIARGQSVITQVRAEHLGSSHYIWRTMHDFAVRPRHRKLDGKVIAWDDPPIAGEREERAHAGQIYNCRCYPEPIIPEEP